MRRSRFPAFSCQGECKMRIFKNGLPHVVSPPSAAGAGQPALTARETECLRWTAEGKTAWEVGRILQISERTANWHLQAASHKLGCANKIQAVVKAIRIGLLG